jgi:hypothetical protein
MLVYDMPDTTYHASPALGSTTAAKALTSIRALGDLLDGTAKVEDRPCFQVGRLAHMMALQPEKFAECVVDVGPINPRTGAPFGRDTLAFQGWQAENPDLVVVEPWLRTMLARMPGMIADTFRAGKNEVSCFVDDQDHGGLAMKCRPDCWHPDARLIYDLKTIAPIDGDFARGVCKAIASRNYWFSAAWYRHCMRLETGHDHHFDLIFAEKGSPFRWGLFTLDDAYVAHGDQVVADLLPRIAYAMQSGDWNDPAPIYHVAECPAWLGGDIHEDDEGGISL